MRIAVINGPNINFLGIREPSIYGDESYEDLIDLIENYVKEKDIEVECFQSNSEGEIIDYIQKCYFELFDGIILNAGAYTHYSYAIRDAISSVGIDTVEVHISNIYEREDFRRNSVVEPVCVKQIYGKRFFGYLDAIDYLEYTNNERNI